MREVSFRAVILDWRGTLATTLTDEAWARAALTRLRRNVSPAQVEAVCLAMRAASGHEDRLDGPGIDADAVRHRQTLMEVFADAGFDDDLAEALYAVESDANYNPFALDVADTLRTLKQRGYRIAILSDIHFDLRPAFDADGMAGLVDVFMLSFEHGLQKPDPQIFTRALGALGVEADQALMVGDRSGPDGAAMEHGITTLLLPPLRTVSDRRLHHLLALCGGRTR